MAVSHRLGTRNSLEFFTFPLGTDAQAVVPLRLPSNEVEVMATTAHAFTCLLRPTDTGVASDQFSELSAAGVFSILDGDAIPNTITHSSGTNQSVGKLRAVEIQLISTAPNGEAAAVDVQVELVFSSGSPGVQNLILAKGGDRSLMVLTIPRGRTLTKIGFSTQQWKKCLLNVLAVGDTP